MASSSALGKSVALLSGSAPPAPGISMTTVELIMLSGRRETIVVPSCSTVLNVKRLAAARLERTTVQIKLFAGDVEVGDEAPVRRVGAGPLKLLLVTPCRAEAVRRAKRASRSGHHDCMAEYMSLVVLDEAGRPANEPSAEERSLLAEAFRGAVGGRRDVCRSIAATERRACLVGSDASRMLARERLTLQREIARLCKAVLDLFPESLIATASDDEVRVFYLKTKAEYQGYAAELLEGCARVEALEKCRAAYRSASEAATHLPPLHPLRLGVAVSHSIFSYDLLEDQQGAVRLARGALVAALEARDLNNVRDETCHQMMASFQALTANLKYWTQGSPAGQKAESEAERTMGLESDADSGADSDSEADFEDDSDADAAYPWASDCSNVKAQLWAH